MVIGCTEMTATAGQPGGCGGRGGRIVARYRDAWMLVTAVTATVGVWTALQTWPVVGVLGAFVCVAFVGGSLAEAAARERGRRRIRPLLVIGALAGVGAVGAAGLMVLSGALGLLVVVVLAASCPKVWAAIRRRQSRASGPGLRQDPPEQPADTGSSTVATAPHEEWPEPTPEDAPEPWLLGDYELCCAWRKSYAVLERPHSTATHLRLVEQRQLYLDEFERRNPTGLAEWLASGARAAGDPTRFIMRRS